MALPVTVTLMLFWEALQALAKALEENSKLQKLQMPFNQLGDAGGKAGRSCQGGDGIGITHVNNCKYMYI